MGNQEGKVKSFDGGKIYVQVANDHIGVVAGQVISGVVHVVQQQPFPAKDITLSFIGVESTWWRVEHRDSEGHTSTSTFTGCKEIVNFIFPISNWIDGQPPPGHYSYPFSLQLPDWLPASMMMAGGSNSSELTIRYTLRAQLTPLNEKDWANRKEKISQFQGSTLIYVFRPTIICPKVDLKFTLKNKIGGFLGMGTSECISDIIFEQNEYYIGDTARVRIICDNSKCKKAVRGFKLKLKCKTVGRDTNDFHQTYHSFYVEVLKAAGCPENSKTDKWYQIKIPTRDKVRGPLAEMRPDQM